MGVRVADLLGPQCPFLPPKAGRATGRPVGRSGYVVSGVIPLLVNRLRMPVSYLDALLDPGCWIALRSVFPDEVDTGHGGGNALIH